MKTIEWIAKIAYYGAVNVIAEEISMKFFTAAASRCTLGPKLDQSDTTSVSIIWLHTRPSRNRWQIVSIPRNVGGS